MRTTYDPDADAFYAYLVENGKVARSIQILSGLTADVDAKGRLIGVELLDARRRFTKKEIDQLEPEVLTGGKLMILEHAAKAAGLTAVALRQQIRRGRLAAEKMGRDWVVREGALDTYLVSRAPQGRRPARGRR